MLDPSTSNTEAVDESVYKIQGKKARRHMKEELSRYELEDRRERRGLVILVLISLLVGALLMYLGHAFGIVAGAADIGYSQDVASPNSETKAPSTLPSLAPTSEPVRLSTVGPSPLPTIQPSITPTFLPTGTPVQGPSATPSSTPSAATSLSPTLAPTRAKSRPMALFSVTNAKVGRCTDGSAPAFWYRAANEGFENKWIIMLESGGMCSDESSCLEREFYYRSGKYLSTSREFAGMFDETVPENTGANYNVVYIHYCSSDAWQGDVDAPFRKSAKKLAHFRGMRIIDEVFSTLMGTDKELERPSDLPILTAQDDVVFGGLSAGARGAMVNADRLRLKHGFSTMRAILDSGYYVNVSEQNFFVVQAKQAFQNFVYGTNGARENQVTSWEDTFGEYRMPQVKLPYLLIASQRDKYQEARDDTGTLSQVIHDRLTQLKPLSPCSIVFSHDQESHATITTNAIAKQLVGNSSVLDIMNMFVDEQGLPCDGNSTLKLMSSHGA